MDIFFLLLFGHALSDFALESETMVSKKQRKNNADSWYIYLAAHSVIHGGFVGFFTGSFLLAMAETVCHFVIDYGTCEGKLSMKLGQTLHVVCKAAWVLLMMNGIV